MRRIALAARVLAVCALAACALAACAPAVAPAPAAPGGDVGCRAVPHVGRAEGFRRLRDRIYAAFGAPASTWRLLAS